MPLKESTISKTLRSLKSRGFHALFTPGRVKARNRILKLIPLHSTIGVGDSTSLYQIEVIPELEARGNHIVHPFRSNIHPPNDLYRMETTLRKSLGQDFFITGANVVTEDGRIISVDGVGNRIAGMVFGAKKVILVLGQNKIVKDLASAFRRIEKVISPGHAKHRGFETPCVQKGECVDCRVKERICNVIAILEGKPMMTDITVILVGEDLGLGWDPNWPHERIEKIWSNYVAKCWRPDLEKIMNRRGRGGET